MLSLTVLSESEPGAFAVLSVAVSFRSGPGAFKAVAVVFREPHPENSPETAYSLLPNSRPSPSSRYSADERVVASGVS